jgi:hypothetical protein
MNVVVLQIMAVAIISAILCFVIMWNVIRGYSTWFDTWRRAEELQRTVLSQEEYRQLMSRAYVDIKSPRDHTRIYRVPLNPGLVEVIEHGRRTASLCLHPLESVPSADLVVIHKLMIEADEETYLQTANRFPPSLGLHW